MSSYLSLAAIENAELLAQHIQPIIDSVISGNYSLSRVLPQIYSVNRDPIKSHVMTLVSIFPNCENTEKMALLNLFALVAKDNPTLLEPSIHQLSDGLTSQATALATLQVKLGNGILLPKLFWPTVRKKNLVIEKSWFPYYKQTLQKNYKKKYKQSFSEACFVNPSKKLDVRHRPLEST
jgi:hypothetical protein